MMKKIYSLSIAFTVALTAVAQEAPTLRSGMPSREKAPVATSVMKAAKPNTFSQGITLKKVSEAPDANGSVAGEYTMLIGDYYFEDSIGEITEECTVSLSGTTITFSSDFFAADVSAAYDAATGEITFKPYQLGPYRQYYAAFEPFAWDSTIEKIVPGSFTATFDGKNIVFPIDHGFSWPIYKNPDYTDVQAYFNVFDVISMESASSSGDPNEGWTSIGNAKLQDGWVLPAFGIDQTAAENIYEVECQRNDSNPDMYRLVNPYKGNCPIASQNEATKVGYIQFDLSNPNYVLFVLVEAGFANAQLGVSKFYCYNSLTWAIENYGLTPEQIMEQVPDCPITKYENGVITLDSTIINGEVANDACFGVQNQILGNFVWKNSEDVAANMTTKIIMPGETGVETILGTDNATVKYFNLQGIEISEPTTGQVVIRVCGDKATKMIAH